MRSPIRHVCHRLLGGFQDSASESTSPSSGVLQPQVLIKTVQVHLTCNKELDRFYVGFMDPNDRNQSNLDYSVLEVVFSLEKVRQNEKT